MSAPPGTSRVGSAPSWPDARSPPVAAPVLGVPLLLRFGLVTGQAWRRTDRLYCYGCGLVVILLPGPGERCALS